MNNGRIQAIGDLFIIDPTDSLQKRKSKSSLERKMRAAKLTGLPVATLQQCILVKPTNISAWYLLEGNTKCDNMPDFQKAKKIPLRSLGEAGLINLQNLLHENELPKIELIRFRYRKRRAA